VRYRTDARLADKTVLEPIPVQRYQCPVHGEVTPTPPGLCKWKHYLAEVIEECLHEYADGVPVAQILPLTEDGPSTESVARWVSGLDDPRVSGWVTGRLDEVERLQAVPSARAHAMPGRARPHAWITLHRLLALARALGQWVHGKGRQLASPLLQQARLFWGASSFG
jgi:hypothetical protein